MKILLYKENVLTCDKFRGLNAELCCSSARKESFKRRTGDFIAISQRPR